MNVRRLLPLAVALVAIAPAALPFVDAGHRSPVRLLVGFTHEGSVPPPGGTFEGGRVLQAHAKARFALVETLSPSALMRLAGVDARVRYVEVDQATMRALGAPNDPRYSEQYGLVRIRAPDAWESTRGDSSVLVAVLDSGADTRHPDLGNLKTGRDFTGGSSVSDACGHGTHVAGIVGATTGNGVGVAGVAQVGVIPVKVLKNSWNGCSGSFSHIASGITWAADQGARVITMSLGCNGCTSQAVVDAVDYATSKGALVIAAAGNAGPCSNCVSFPATLPKVMAVGCTDASDALCRFSSTGSQVEIAAPGDAILSTWPNAGYNLQSGTSMSAPHVAGVAALVLSANPSLGASEVRDILLRTARDLGAAGRDTSYGYGLLDAHAAVAAAGGSTSTNAKPTAAFDANANGLFVAVDGEDSRDPDGRVVSWRWDWGDGTAAASGVSATHTYAAGGTYTVKLTVTDDAGATASTTRDVTVSRPSAILEETFDDGSAQGWTLTGLWRLGSTCVAGRSPANALQFNQASTCTYATGARATGTATITLDLTPKANPSLTFSSYHEVERANGPYDTMRVQVSTDGGATWTTLWTRDARSSGALAWTDATLDLTPYKTSATQVRFAFDSVDRYYNAYKGWAIDDVVIA